MTAADSIVQLPAGRFAAIDFRVKLVLLLLASTLIFVWNNLLAQGLLLGFTIALMLAAATPLATIWRLIRLTLPALVLIVVIQGLWSPFGIHPVFTLPQGLPLLGGAHVFTVEGLLFGLVVCCRILVPLLAFQLVFMTTEANDIVLGLTRLRVPYRVALLFSTTFRFVPLLLEEFQAIKDAQRLRGIDLDSFGMVRKLVAMGRMLVPLITGCLAKAQAMEIALQARAFTGSPDRTQLHPGREKLTAAQRAMIALALLFWAAAIVARIAFGMGGSVL
ncbi:energy-coupling factor transporter transmembrane component T [Kaistia geumhonensis]|uniref:Energy-coupling factor transport system permease protein n=1 Tax=Kaistia geumhonensis TaxID=410839 RepID=A0ABU0M6D6_9HYPH|nr:energy-coupling factor transporter transmembrane component T [Kaistia geumhonensis]MCX5478264.1 energy-coupling factor transporter transmembrane component T [Kaistia geumhonensis]MDQ0516519.1 energy-coupling factor transport system permease protein [Kaistia geumhonensis]